MAVYRFKVCFEDDENISREIEIRSTQTFEDFHNIIQDAIGFDNVHPTSFYVSGDTWRKSKEITLIQKKHTAGLKGTWMHETKIAAYMEDPHQRFVYEFDPDGGNWILLVELMKIIPEASVQYPRINKSTGTSPQQYKLTAAEIIPVEEEDEEGTVAVVDDSQDAYIHPEAGQQYEAAEDEETIPASLVKEVAMELPAEEATDEEPEEVDEEDESAEQEDFA